MPQAVSVVEFHRLPIPLDRDLFMRTMLREIAQTLEDKLGGAGATDFVSEIGTAAGEQLNIYYRAALRTTSLTREQVAQACIDLKRRIQGDFYVIEQTDEKIVLGNRACPFGISKYCTLSVCHPPWPSNLIVAAHVPPAHCTNLLPDAASHGVISRAVYPVSCIDSASTRPA